MYAGLQEPRGCRSLLSLEHGELRHLLRLRRRHNHTVSASLRRSRFTKGAEIALTIMQSA
jgi:putative transposase